MRAELANLNPCAVPFLSRATVNLCWFCCIYISIKNGFKAILVVKVTVTQNKVTLRYHTVLGRAAMFSVTFAAMFSVTFTAIIMYILYNI